MDNLFDLILPIVFVVGSVFVSRMMKGEKEEETSEIPPGDLSTLKEEIRRRIEATQQQRQEAMTQERVPPVKQPLPTYNRQVERPGPGKVAASYNQYESMRHQVEEIRAKADHEQRKAASIMKGKGSAFSMSVFHAPAGKHRSRGLIGEVIRELHHPASARKAVINTEILGPPVGLRRPGQVHASWEQ
jgi:hypothetical protein